jgi:hypothetical protein
MKTKKEFRIANILRVNVWRNPEMVVKATRTVWGNFHVIMLPLGEKDR